MRSNGLCALNRVRRRDSDISFLPYHPAAANSFIANILSRMIEQTNVKNNNVSVAIAVYHSIIMELLPIFSHTYNKELLVVIIQILNSVSIQPDRNICVSIKKYRRD